MRLNLGCGSLPEPGYINVDAVAQDAVDVVQDLDSFPWPWPDGAIERIRAFDVFEHVDDPLGFMRESHRVLRKGGVLDIHTTHWKSRNAYTDPTHKRYNTEETFDYWVPGTYLHGRYGAAYAAGAEFQKLNVGMAGTELAVLLKKL